MNLLARPKLLIYGVSVYAFCLLLGQAAMSIGAGVSLLFAMLAYGGPLPLFRALADFCRNADARAYFRATLALAAALIASLLVARIWPLHLGTYVVDVRAKDLQKLWFLFIPLLTGTALANFSREESEGLFRWWSKALALVIAFAYVQAWTGYDFSSWPPTFKNLFPSILPASVFYGSYLTYAAVLPFFLFYLADRARLAAPGEKRHLYAIFVLGILSFIVSFSRTAWIAVPIGLFVYAAKMLTEVQRRRVVLAVAICFVVSAFLPELRARALSFRGWTERIDIWKMNWEFFRLRPILGVGWHQNGPLSAAYVDQFYTADQHKFAGHAHNNFLQMLSGTGLIGFAAWIAWNYRVMKIAYRTTFGIFVAFIVFHLNGLTQANFWESKTTHVVMFAVGLTLAAAAKAGNQESASKNRRANAE